MEKRPNVSTILKKVLFLTLQFLNDATEEIVTQELRKVVQKTFTLVRFPEFSTSMCVQQFHRSFGVSYIELTVRQVRHRITEHHPS